ncbi:hypothetical protein ABT071_26070 [Streptomyces sp. NPDC002506]|uniref:hypothetical protein n=1 Tax=unclassified Streptomyces TaxID=2593676 RepID=UPI00131BAA96|nr:hypothetical protein [Streptomyces sp. CB01201]
MSTKPPDQELWDSFVEAKRELHRRQADFYQQASDRQAVLRAALAPERGAWQQGTAFDYLNAFHYDVIPLLPELFRWAVKSERWAGPAREVIAGIPSDQRIPLLEPLFLDQLAAAEDDDYPNLASLAVRCEAWPLLKRLVQQAGNHANPDVREVVDHCNQTYSPM